MTFFMIFSEIFKKNMLKSSKSLKISILLLESVRVLSRVANLASEYFCSNSCSFLDMTFFLVFFFQNFSEKLGIDNFTKLEILSL